MLYDAKLSHNALCLQARLRFTITLQSLDMNVYSKLGASSLSRTLSSSERCDGTDAIVGAFSGNKAKTKQRPKMKRVLINRREE